MSVTAPDERPAAAPSTDARRKRGATASGASAAQGLNALFHLLQRVETEPLEGKLIVRRTGNVVAGAWQARGGRIRTAATAEGRDLLADELTRACDVSPADAARLADETLPPGAPPDFERLRDAARLDDRATRRLALAFTAGECLQTAMRCAGETPDVLRLGAPQAPSDWEFAALEVFIAAAARLDRLPGDAASAVYAELAEKVDAALLVLRPTAEGQLPTPIACRGLDGAALSEVLPVCRGAAEIGRPSAFRRAGWNPSLTMNALDDDAWISATGEHRCVLLRVEGRGGAARVVATAMSRVRAATASPA